MDSAISSKYLSPPYANSDCGSLRSYDSIFPPSVSSRDGQVHINAAYDNLGSGDVVPSSKHDYEDLHSVRTESLGPRRKDNDLYATSVSSRDGQVHINAAYDNSGSEDVVPCPNYDYEDLQSIRMGCKGLPPALGPRRKDNDLYEPTGPLKHRIRQITECSDDFSASSVCSASPSWKKDSCLSKLILCLILTFSVAALVLVILIIYGTLGPKCGCKDFNTENKAETPRTGMQVSVQSLLSRIKALESDMLAMKNKMEARDNAVKMFVTKHESQVEVLQAQVNETANKVATVDGVWVNMRSTHDAFEKKLDSEFKQLNKSVKELNNKDNQLSSQVSELRQNQMLTKRMSERLAINVTDVESRVQELKKNNGNISSRAASLEKGYTQMNNLMKTLQAIDAAQNASQTQLESTHKRLRDSLTAVNATLNDKLKNLDSSSDKPGANFSLCEHKTVKGVSGSADALSGRYTAVYQKPQDKQVMGVTCSTNIARHYRLEEPIPGIFKCICRNLSPVFGSGTKTMQCVLHVWQCPI